MLVDLNACIGHWPFQQLQYNTCSGILGRMDQFGVDISVVANLNGIFYKNVQSANEELFQELRSIKLRDRLIPFAVINPSYAGWKQDVTQCKEEFGMKGIRLYPKYHDYSVTDTECLELVKYARDLDMPVALTLRMVDFRQRSWMDISDEWALRDVMPLVRAVPDAKYLVLNIANGPQLDEADTALIKKSNVLMDTSGRALTNLADLVARYGRDKFGFGTHAPIQDYLTGLLRIEALRPTEADAELKQLLRSGNARRFLNL